MMNEDEMRDKILQELMSSMDDMSAKKPSEDRPAVSVAIAEPNPGPSPDKFPSPTTKTPKGPYLNPKRNEVMQEIEDQSAGGMKPTPSPSMEDAQSMADEEEGPMFKGFMKRRRG